MWPTHCRFIAMFSLSHYKQLLLGKSLGTPASPRAGVWRALHARTRAYPRGFSLFQGVATQHEQVLGKWVGQVANPSHQISLFQGVAQHRVELLGKSRVRP